MTAWLVTAVVAAVALTANGVARGQTARPPVVLMDSTGKVAARPLNETIVLVTINGVAAPALIRPIYGPDGRIASGLATWQSGGSVLFTSSDCTTGAHVYSLPHAGVCGRAGSDPAGIVLTSARLDLRPRQRSARFFTTPGVLR